MENIYLDIRNYKKLNKIIKKINPEIIFHMAAQPLVKMSSMKSQSLTLKQILLAQLMFFRSIKKIKKFKIFYYNNVRQMLFG